MGKIIGLKIRSKKRGPLRGKAIKDKQCGHLFDGMPCVQVDRVSAVCSKCGEYLDPLWVLYSFMKETEFLEQYFDELQNRVESKEGELKALDHKIHQRKSILKPDFKPRQTKLFK